jgi:hypothetical protein
MTSDSEEDLSAFHVPPAAPAVNANDTTPPPTARAVGVESTTTPTLTIESDGTVRGVMMIELTSFAALSAYATVSVTVQTACCAS